MIAFYLWLEMIPLHTALIHKNIATLQQQWKVRLDNSVENWSQNLKSIIDGDFDLNIYLKWTLGEIYKRTFH